MTVDSRSWGVVVLSVVVALRTVVRLILVVGQTDRLVLLAEILVNRRLSILVAVVCRNLSLGVALLDRRVFVGSLRALGDSISTSPLVGWLEPSS